MTRGKLNSQPGTVSRAARKRGPNRPFLGLLVLVSVALIGIACYFFFRAQDTAPTQRSEAPQKEEVIRRYRQALQVSPDDADMHSTLAAALASRGSFAEAIQHFREAARIDPNRAEAHLNLGNALAVQERFDDAIPHYRKAIQLKPDYAKAHNNLAVALKETGELQEAYQHINEAMRLKRGAKRP